MPSLLLYTVKSMRIGALHVGEQLSATVGFGRCLPQFTELVMLRIKPEMLLKMGAVMQGGEYGVCLVPQHFHNVIYPDALDHSNYDMVNKLEFAFAGGILLLTGANQPLTFEAWLGNKKARRPVFCASDRCFHAWGGACTPGGT